MIFHKPKSPYSQEEVSEQIGQLSHLTKLRDSAYQKALSSDYKQDRYLEEVNRYDDMIEAAQMVYEFMMGEIQEWILRSK